MKEPNMINKMKNLSTAMVNWATTDKFGKVSPEVFQQRKSICEICPYWDKDGFNGMGKCNKCGCSIGKLYLPSSQCPDDPPRWLKFYIENTST